MYVCHLSNINHIVYNRPRENDRNSHLAVSGRVHVQIQNLGFEQKIEFLKIKECLQSLNIKAKMF